MRILTFLSLLLFMSCSAPVQRPTGAAYDYDAAKDMLKKGRLDRAIEFSDGLATAKPPNQFTQRARVLRAIIYTGQIKGYKALADAYGKGAQKTKDPQVAADYGRLRHDVLEFGTRTALGLAETAQQLTGDGSIAKELTIEVTYPATEGPVEIEELARIQAGTRTEPAEQDNAAKLALSKGIADTLAEVFGGDRSKARMDLTAGPVQISGADFALFLGNELLEGARFYDRKHTDDPDRLQTVCNEADAVAKAALALLKENPNPEKEKAVKQLQDQIKAALKEA
jgi:hypothetical protein